MKLGNIFTLVDRFTATSSLFSGDPALDPEIQARTRKDDEREEDETEIGSLKLKLPAFWPDKAEAWFVQAESHFKARRITSQQTKYHLVVVALDSDTVDGVLDLLERPPEDDPFDQLKARLVQSFKISKVDKIKRALEFPPVDEENPVKMADKIMALTRDASGEDIAKAVFMLKLPDAVRKTMWSEPLVSWPEMKARASGLWYAERTRKQSCVYEAAPRPAERKRTPCGPRRRTRTPVSSRNSPPPSPNDKTVRAFSMTSSASRPPSAASHVRRRETEGPGGSSDRLGRITHATRRKIESIIPGRHRGRGQRRASSGTRAAGNAAEETTRGSQRVTNLLLRRKKLRLQVGSRAYEWKFLVADVRRPLIGADFLTHSSLLVDLKNGQLVHPEELNSTPLQRTKRRAQITGLAFATDDESSKLAKLFAEFPEVTVPNFKLDRPKHKVKHTIETKGQPIRARARPLPPQKLAAAKAAFAEMVTAGIVRRSNGAWSSPLHVVTKKDGSFRMCGDYRRLNSVTTPDRYSIPLITDLTARLHGQKDIRKGGPRQRIPPGPSGGRRRSQNGDHHAVWHLRVPTNAVWIKECWPNVPTNDGRDTERSGLLVHIYGRCARS